MARIDTSAWKAFQLGGDNGIFEIVKGKRLTKADMRDGNINFIGSSADNNGITNHISNRKNIHPGNLITVAYNGSVGETFYQEEEFVASDDVNILYPKFDLNKYIALFLCSVIRAVGKNYIFIDKWKKEDMEKDVIYLPVKKDDTPDWKFMEHMMRKYEIDAQKHIENLVLVESMEKNKRNLSKHKRFHLYDEDLFDIDSGTKLDKVRMSNKAPSINFVGRANANNGVTDFIDEIDGIEPYKAGYLTVSLGGEYLGSCFIQSKPFYTSQNVNVLIPRHEMSDYSKQYIATMVFREGRIHYKAFVNELNCHMKTDFTIPLPVKDDGSIDWEYMDSYMKNLKQISLERLKILQEIDEDYKK